MIKHTSRHNTRRYRNDEVKFYRKYGNRIMPLQLMDLSTRTAFIRYIRIYLQIGNVTIRDVSFLEVKTTFYILRLKQISI